MQIGVVICRLMVALVLAIGYTGSALAVDATGRKFDDTAIVAGQQLQLNGMGARVKLFIRLYDAALYLKEKHSVPADVLLEPGAKRVAMIMARDFSSDTFAQAFIDGIKKNSDLNERGRYIAQMLNFGLYFGTVAQLKQGDVLTVDWIPGIGTVISINGKRIGEAIPDEGFYRALLKIWLGNNPVDAGLKSAMLRQG
ncbi:MAG: chalcone isomerase family protein [Burkholderiaceae bacterium]|nr:chalcone isomerase family protein [Burkholderiaceae bacterium]